MAWEQQVGTGLPAVLSLIDAQRPPLVCLENGHGFATTFAGSHLQVIVSTLLCLHVRSFPLLTAASL